MIKEVAVSHDVEDQLIEWFPYCDGIVDVDDAWDALYGYNISSGELYDLISRLRDSGVVEFMPQAEEVEHETRRVNETNSTANQVCR